METSLSSCRHTCTQLDVLLVGEVEGKEELKNLLILREYHGRLQNFHAREKKERN